MDTYSEELAFAKKLALQAGQLMYDNFATATSSVKQNLTPVTEIDLAISKLVASEISKHFPQHGLLDEEINTDTQKDGYVWICDPIDGTIPYAHKTPTSVFSLALCKDGEPVLGVVYDPYMKRLLHTAKGESAFMNDVEIYINTEQLETGRTIATIPYWNCDVVDYDKLYGHFSEKDIFVTGIESVVYILMLVASGVMVGAIMPSANPWDRAAGLLLVQNAGGKFTDENGEVMTVFGKNRCFVVSNGVVHEQLQAALTLSLK